MSILSPDVSEGTVELNLEFDAPQWEDLQREKDLVEQGTWSVGSDIYDSWFKEVHPLHEAKSIEQHPQKKSIVDRKGNKLSLGVSKTGLAKKLNEKEVEKPTAKKTCQRKSGADELGQNGVKKQRPCWNLDGCHTISISPNHIEQPQDQPRHVISRVTKHSNSDVDSADEELRAMLDTHNRRIMRQRAEYDENGRRIQKGNPMMCPAPMSKSKIENCNGKLKSKRRSVNVVQHEAPKVPKQKRRSCFTLSTMQEMSPNISERKAQNNEKVTPKSAATSTVKNTALNGQKNIGTTAVNSQKSTRIAEKDSSKTTGLNGQKSFNAGEGVSKTTGLNRQKSFKASEGVSKTTGLNRQKSFKTDGVSKTTTLVRQESLKNAEKQTLKIASNKKRSLQVSEKQRKSTDAEDEIKELIAQHNSKLAAKRAKK